MTDVQHDAAVEDDYDPFEAFNKAMGSQQPGSPYPKYQDLLEQCPVLHGHTGGLDSEGGGPDLLVFPEADVFTALSFAAVDQVLRDNETFSSRGYEKHVGLVMGHTILEMDEPEHHAYRSLIQQAFTRKEMDRWEVDIVGPIVNRYIDEFAPRGRADLVNELTFPFPNEVIATALGLPEEDRYQFYVWAIEMTNMMAEPVRGFAAAQALGEYFGRLADERRDDPGEDLISLLTQCELDGQRLTNDEILAFCRLLLPAGSETTYRSSSNLLYGLLTNPDQLDALYADRSLIPQAIEEGLRWEPPLTNIARTATRAVEVEGVSIPAGALVSVCLGAANHDPSRWDKPDEFDMFRKSQNHVAFATGVHLCLGIHLARMETRDLLELVLDRLPNLRFDPDVDVGDIVGWGFRAPRALPVVFDAS